MEMSLVLQVFVNWMSAQNFVAIHLLDTEILDRISKKADLWVALQEESGDNQSHYRPEDISVCTTVQQTHPQAGVTLGRAMPEEQEQTARGIEGTSRFSS